MFVLPVKFKKPSLKGSITHNDHRLMQTVSIHLVHLNCLHVNAQYYCSVFEQASALSIGLIPQGI